MEHFEIDTDDPEEAMTRAMEEYMKKHPNADFSKLKIVSLEKVEKN